jgi:hypothetical protein
MQSDVHAIIDPLENLSYFNENISAMKGMSQQSICRPIGLSVHLGWADCHRLFERADEIPRRPAQQIRSR